MYPTLGVRVRAQGHLPRYTVIARARSRRQWSLSIDPRKGRWRTERVANESGGSHTGTPQIIHIVDLRAGRSSHAGAPGIIRVDELRPGSRSRSRSRSPRIIQARDGIHRSNKPLNSRCQPSITAKQNLELPGGAERAGKRAI
ncbi:hypothetical protein FRC08_000615 [Ceratobasidium sp. 394]|nr:hypothetical protein FRC08_000615 [Ceratobasidium sp. 394]